MNTQREIKFKIWDKNDTKELIGPFKWNKIPNFQFPENFDIVQYTGLKDKNGVEIYEGDRVTYKLDKLYYFSEVKWGNCGWLIDDVDAAFPLSELPGLEVVGNIFQLPCNPDHNGECLVCDCWLCDCPFNKDKDDT